MLTDEQKSATYPFTLSPLPFAYDALEPHIDAATMRVHHTKHHQSYITKLNAALKDYPELHNFSTEELLKRLDKLPIAIRQTIHDQGGGHLHHQFFWSILRPGTSVENPPRALAEAIDRDFGSFEEFKEKFFETGLKHFASGWVFLAQNPATAKLEVFSRPDHNNIVSEKKHILLINDLWEHAYYLKHQSDRTEYLNSFWNIVNWERVGQLYENLPASKPRLMGVTK